jgi:hypothetical protein
MGVKTTLLAGLLLAAPLLQAPKLHALEATTMLQGNLAGEYSSETGGPASWNPAGNLLLVPIIGISPEDYLAPVLLADMKTRSTIINEDNEYFTERLILMAKPSWKHVYGESGWELGLHGVAKNSTNLENNRPWSKGLYDNEEYGAGLDLSLPAWKGLLTPSSLSLQWSRRSYNNNFNNINSVVDNREYRVKDSLFYRLDFSTALSADYRLASKLKYTAYLRDYTDSYVYQPNLTLDLNQPQAEQFHALSLDNAKLFGDKWLASLYLEGDLFESNQNIAYVQANSFVKDFYSFYSVQAKPGLTWLLQGKPEGHSISFSYQALNRVYTHRRIEHTDFTYAQGVAADFEQDLDLRGNYYLSKHLDLYLEGMADYVHSNQQYDPVVRPNYELYKIQLGLDFKY